jgi:hypothetical protein
LFLYLFLPLKRAPDDQLPATTSGTAIRAAFGLRLAALMLAPVLTPTMADLQHPLFAAGTLGAEERLSVRIIHE